MGVAHSDRKKRELLTGLAGGAASLSRASQRGAQKGTNAVQETQYKKHRQAIQAINDGYVFMKDTQPALEDLVQNTTTCVQADAGSVWFRLDQPASFAFYRHQTP